MVVPLCSDADIEEGLFGGHLGLPAGVTPLYFLFSVATVSPPRAAATTSSTAAWYSLRCSAYAAARRHATAATIASALLRWRNTLPTSLRGSVQCGPDDAIRADLLGSDLGVIVGDQVDRSAVHLLGSDALNAPKLSAGSSAVIGHPTPDQRFLCIHAATPVVTATPSGI